MKQTNQETENIGRSLLCMGKIYLTAREYCSPGCNPTGAGISLEGQGVWRSDTKHQAELEVEQLGKATHNWWPSYVSTHTNRSTSMPVISLLYYLPSYLIMCGTDRWGSVCHSWTLRGAEWTVTCWARVMAQVSSSSQTQLFLTRALTTNIFTSKYWQYTF